MMTRELKPIARRLRRDATSAERRLWRTINNRQIAGYKFRRQVVLSGFIVDFACYDARLVLEVDGATHSSEEEVARDRLRVAGLTNAGYSVLRFQNAEIYENLEGVVETIRLKLLELRPVIEDVEENGAGRWQDSI